MTKVFVYGSLLEGFGNHRLLESATKLRECETLPEMTMVSLGGFPGVFASGNTAIKGELYEVTPAEEQRLDGLEGVYPSDPKRGLYRKEYITLADGEEDVLIYIYNGDDSNLSHYEVIDSGSWRQFKSSERGLRYRRYG